MDIRIVYFYTCLSIISFNCPIASGSEDNSLVTDELVSSSRNETNMSVILQGPETNKYPRLIPTDPKLKFMVVMSQGEVYSHKIEPGDLFKWSDGKNRSFAVYLATEHKDNVTIFESIFFDSDQNVIWALPMSDNAGQNRYHIMARGFGDNITSIPYEAIVLPNANIPNHKFLLHFEYNYLVFEAFLPFRLEVLRLLSIILGDSGNVNNITLDSYENTTLDSYNGTSQMLIRISNSTIGYEPCNSTQMKRILGLYRRLSIGDQNEPTTQVSHIFGNYNLVKVELELIGPCVRQQGTSDMYESVGVLGASWLRIFFLMFLGLVLVTTLVFGLVCICRRRRQRLSVSVKKSSSNGKGLGKSGNGDASNFFVVKSKHIPVIFADEYDQESSINQVSAAAPLILKNEKPPAKDLLSKLANGSANHTPSCIDSPGFYSINPYSTANGNNSMSSFNTNNLGPNSAILCANSQSSNLSHRYSPSQFRPPPPYKPPSKSIVHS